MRKYAWICNVIIENISDICWLSMFWMDMIIGLWAESLKTFSLCASVRKVSRQSLNVSPNRFYSSWQLATHLSQSDWGRQIWKWSLLTLLPAYFWEMLLLVMRKKERRKFFFTNNSTHTLLQFHLSLLFPLSLSPGRQQACVHVCMYSMCLCVKQPTNSVSVYYCFLICHVCTFRWWHLTGQDWMRFFPRVDTTRLYSISVKKIDSKMRQCLYIPNIYAWVYLCRESEREKSWVKLFLVEMFWLLATKAELDALRHSSSFRFFFPHFAILLY